MSASAMTERAIMARVEPRALSIPSSRVRSSIVIESALKTRNAPTKSAVPAKKSSEILNPWSWLVISWVRVSERSACKPSPSPRSSLPRNSSTGVPSAASTAMPEILPGSSKAARAYGSGAMPNPNPPKEPPGIRRMPTSSSFSGPRGVPSVTLSPTFSPALSAEPPSRVISFPLSGNLPSVSSKPGASDADSGSTPKRRMLWTSGSPFCCFLSRMSDAGSERRGAADSTPS
jgi:hypothetical protein